MDSKTKKKLEEIFTVLDLYIGDTDPYFDDEMTDEDIRDEEPVFWACKEIGLLLRPQQGEGE